MRGVSTVAAARPAPPGKRSVWAWVRVLGGVGILALLGWQVGTGPFLAGVRVVDGSALAAAAGIGVATTVCCAWRWSLVAAGFGVRLPLREAVTAYYRSQFLNATLPGGVVGDVHRAVRHGLDLGDVGLGARAVVLERLAGQAVQIAIAVAVLVAFPSPVRPYLPVVAGGVVVVGLGVVVVVWGLARGRRWMRALRAAGRDIRDGLFVHRTWIGVVVVSAVAVVGHVATFLLAARTAGSPAPLTLLLPLALLALLAMGLPLNVAGWGPREGVAAWAFGAAGLTATQGVAAAVTYGVLVLVASLPGAGVLMLRWIGRVLEARRPVATTPSPAPALRHGGARG